MSVAPPSAEQVLTDLGASGARIWKYTDFGTSENRLHVVAAATFPCAAENAWRGCSGTLMLAVYRLERVGWVLSAKHVGGVFGAFGEPPEGDLAAMALGSHAAFALDEWSSRHDDLFREIFVIEGKDLRSLGSVQLADNSGGYPECEQKKSCWEWTGVLRALPSETSGFPDLRLDPSGTQRGENDRVLPKTQPVDYAYSAKLHVYTERGKEAEFIAQQERVQAQAAAFAAQGLGLANQWYAADVNFSSCQKSRSPADRIRMIQDSGSNAEVRDLPGGAVEVGQLVGDQLEYFTYYRDQASCIAALPKSQPIPKKYE